MRSSYITIVAAIIIHGIMVPQCSARRIAQGDDFPAFSVKTLSGIQVDRDTGSNRMAMVAFLMAGQKSSEQAAQDLQRVITSYEEHRHEMDIVIVMDDPVFTDAFKDTAQDPNDAICLVHDVEKELWGQFHIIAAPTVIISDKSDKVTSVIVGHGYDFIPSLRFHLNQALGIAQTMTAEEVGKVKTVQNKTSSARIRRHLKMAKMLEDKGRTDASLQQLDQASKIDPNDLQVVLEIGRLNCVRSKPDLALKALEGRDFTTPAGKAASELVLGWASRLQGDFEAAQQHLLKATSQDPTSVRAWFELGQVYEATSQNDLALKAYKEALLVLMECE